MVYNNMEICIPREKGPSGKTNCSVLRVWYPNVMMTLNHYYASTTFGLTASREPSVVMLCRCCQWTAGSICVLHQRLRSHITEYLSFNIFIPARYPYTVLIAQQVLYQFFGIDRIYSIKAYRAVELSKRIRTKQFCRRPF